MTPILAPGAGGRAGLNLSEWALHHRPMVLFLIVVAALMGALAYTKLGQSEDPPFTFKVMVVRTDWPGATAREVEEQVTDRIERKLQELPVEYLRSYSKPGESLVFVALRDSMPSSAIPGQWYQVRKKIGDIRGTLPAGIRGPYFNDEFGDTYTNLYALTGDGFGDRELKTFGDRLRAELLRVPGVAKVDFIGEQEERIFVEFSNAKLATLGLDAAQLIATLAAQNAVAPAGSFEAATDRIHLRPSGSFDSVEAIRELSLRANGRIFRLGDVADVRRGYVDPPRQKMRWQGEEALGIGVTMVAGGDVIELGRDLDRAVERMRAELPVGVDVDAVASMPKAVQRSINEFVRALAEAVAIVLVVSLISLGLRTGLVVAVSIPLVLATTFLLMDLFGIGLHKISLGALVLSLGLLVDDAIIAVEMMAVKLEQGFDRFRAASFAWTSTAFPMLTGTLVTVAGFLPIATAKSSTGEYTRSLFEVSAIALVVSWFVAVIVIPYLGYRMLPDSTKLAAAAPWRRWWARLRGRPASQPRPVAHDAAHVYDTPFYRRLRALVDWTVAHRVLVIAATLAAFAGALALFRLVPQQFFPSSSRPELIVDLRLPEGSSFAATLAEAKRMEVVLAGEPGIESFVGYVGAGSPRFYLPLDQQLVQSNFAQFVLVAKDNRERERVRERLIRLFQTDFPALRGRVSRLENGPPVGFPVQFRVSGEDLAKVRAIAREVRAVMEREPALANVQFDWDEPSKVIRLAIDQDKARVLGLSSQDIAQFLNTSVSGTVVTQYREDNKLIDVVLRGAEAERAQLSFLRDLAIPSRSGVAVPITQVARLEYGLEEGIVWRRNREPTVTVRADLNGDAQGPDVTNRISPRLDPLRAGLPVGYRIEAGGAVEDSARGQKSIVAGVPLLVLSVLTLLMIQLKSFSRTLMVVLTAPLGLIGVTLGLLAFRMPFGFVAMLGTIALSGIIMRNSVILVDQIEQDIDAGASPWDAIVGATVRRFRPIVLTAAAAVFAMVPLARSDFFGPMAVAMMGGIIVATALTLGFLPALYALWFRVRRPVQSRFPPIDDARAMSLSPIPEIVADLKAGRMVVLVDEEDRENEGDLVLAAQHVTPEAINFMVRHARGLVCLTLTEERCRQLGLAPMVRENRSGTGTNFTASIEAAAGVTTGISAADRARTIQAAIAPDARPADLVQPGHVFPVMAMPGGVLSRAGHTEAGCDLARLAGLEPASVICEIMKDDGTMARLPDLIGFAEQHGLRIGTIADLIHYRSGTEKLVERVAERPIATAHGAFRLVVYREKLTDATHLALVRGPIAPDVETLVRVHEPLSVMDLLDAQSESHSWSIPAALATVAEAGRGVIVLLHRPESAQDLRRRAVAGEPPVATKVDLRNYGIGAQILRDLNVGRMRLLARPRRMPSMAGFDLEVTGYQDQPRRRSP